MLVASPHDLHHVFENVEWDTLLFFAALFVMIEALAEMGLIRWIGNIISDIIAAAPQESRMYVAITVILVASAIVSGFLDNIPYTTTMVPVIVQLANDESLGLELGPLIWSLSLGACLGGNMTLVGASANLVTAGGEYRRNSKHRSYGQCDKCYKHSHPAQIFLTHSRNPLRDSLRSSQRRNTSGTKLDS